MSISQVLTILFRRSWIILLTLASALIAASAVLIFVPSRYDAFATATVHSATDPVSGAGPSANMMGLVQGNLLQLVESERVGTDVVRRLNLTANPTTQEQYRRSASFGRESIEDWMAGSILSGVDPKFELGSNVLSIRYKSAQS